MPSFIYDDIINLPYPNDNWDFRIKHPRMSIDNRAKIFSPYAALRGHNDKISDTAKNHLKVCKETLLEDSIAQLDNVFMQLINLLNKGAFPKVSVYYFVHSYNNITDKGNYKNLIGNVKKIDLSNRLLWIENNKICLNDIQKMDLI